MVPDGTGYQSADPRCGTRLRDRGVVRGTRLRNRTEPVGTEEELITGEVIELHKLRN